MVETKARGRRVPTQAEKDFGRRLVEAMDAAGYRTQRQRALAVKVAPSAWARYERGERRPKPEVIERVVQLTGKDRLHFYGADELSVGGLLAQALEEVLWRVVVDDVPVGQAFDEAVLDDRWLSPAGRKRLEEIEPKLKRWLMQQAPIAWSELTAVGQRQVVREAARFLVKLLMGDQAVDTRH